MSHNRPPSAGRPVAASRRKGSAASSNADNDPEKFEYECKAAYLVIADDTDENLTSMNQLKNALAQTGRNVPKKRLQKYWTEDTESVSFDEFCDICRKEPVTTEDDLMKAFKKIDINGDGFITNSELRRTLTTKGDPMTAEEVQEIIDEVDQNKDGKLNYSEFCTMLLGTQEQAKKLAAERMEKRLKKGKGPAYVKPSPRRKDSDTGSVSGSRSSVSGSRGSLSGVEDQPPKPLETVFESNSEQTAEDSEALKQTIVNNNLAMALDPEEAKPLETVNEDHAKPADEPIVQKIVYDDFAMALEAEHSDPQDGGVENSDDDDDDDIVIGSKVSLSSSRQAGPKPKPRQRGIVDKSRAKEDPPVSSRSIKDRHLNSVASSAKKLRAPKRLSEWQKVTSGGCFFLDTDTNQVVSHQYSLKLTQETSVWITIEPRNIGNMAARADPVDTQVMILRKDSSLVTFTEIRELKGKYGVRCDLERGEYSVIPLTSGCRLRTRESEPSVESKLLRKKGEKYLLSKNFKEALGDIFKMCDLDGDGLLSRQEFDFFNLRTSGEGVADEEWEVVEENVNLEDGKITEAGFIDLNQMEADDNDGDTEDLWVTLECMGYNKGLQLDQACPYMMEIFAEEGDPMLKVVQVESISDIKEKVLTDATIDKGEASKVKHMKDLHLHSYITDFQATFVVENKSHSRVTIALNCSRSRNCISHQASLDHSVEIPRGQSKLVHHLMPIDETMDWSISCVETVIK